MADKSTPSITDGRRLSRLARYRLFWFVAFLTPALVVYGGIVLYPLMSALLYSFYDWSGIIRLEFVGLENFVRLVTLYPIGERVVNASGNNVTMFTANLFIRIGIALGLALLVVQKLRGAAFFRALFFGPRLLSPVIVGFMWVLILNPTFGVVNYSLRFIGLEDYAQAWLGNPDYALWVVIVVNIWLWFGLSFILYVAGLNNIPKELTESAIIDGTSTWQRFRHVTFPLLAPSHTIVIVLTFTQSFQVFDVVYALSGSRGEPVFSTDTLALLFYRTSFGSGATRQDAGLGAALAVLMFIFIFGITSLLLRVLRKREVQY